MYLYHSGQGPATSDKGVLVNEDDVIDLEVSSWVPPFGQTLESSDVFVGPSLPKALD